MVHRLRAVDSLLTGRGAPKTIPREHSDIMLLLTRPNTATRRLPFAFHFHSTPNKSQEPPLNATLPIENNDINSRGKSECVRVRLVAIVDSICSLISLASNSTPTAQQQLFPKSRKLAYDSRQQLSQVQNGLICPSELFLSLDELSRYVVIVELRNSSLNSLCSAIFILLPIQLFPLLQINLSNNSHNTTTQTTRPNGKSHQQRNTSPA